MRKPHFSVVLIVLVLVLAQMSPASPVTQTLHRRTIDVARCLPPGLFERYAAVLAILVGAIAIGVEKKRAWASFFTRQAFGSRERRVRGYLRVIDPPGVSTARPSIGLENLGTKSVAIGVGTPYASHAQETFVEFVGTRDDSPPEMRVVSGIVLVDGEAVETKRLTEGDIIEIEGLQYQYLRGNRR